MCRLFWRGRPTLPKNCLGLKSEEQRTMAASCVMRITISVRYGGIFDRVANRTANGSGISTEPTIGMQCFVSK